ncbi:MAG TPA: YraN family protein [Syntrophales bacterium]|nr:YraN family protein [Syntrophales bacterium]HOL58800.1 YraN family protein [Syntrophales bacterium]HPO35127.1 YraN family protein [Syntrophales bacterium]
MEKSKSATGFRGEEAAAQFLKQKGLKILERNFHCPLGELDIVGREGNVVVFVEVRTRRSTRFGTPLESVDERKKRRLSRLALFYLKGKGWEDKPARFDVVGVKVKEKGEVEIDWVRDAFDFHP